MAFLSMRHDFRAPAFAPASSQEIYATALEQFAWADATRLRLARALGAPRRRRRLDAGAADDGRARCSRARSEPRVMISACDPAVARPDPGRRADRGARQRVPGPARGSCSAPAIASRSSRWPDSSTRRADASSKTTCRPCSRRCTGEPFEWRGRDVRRHAEAGHRSRAACCSSAAACRPRRGARRACGCRCSR